MAPVSGGPLEDLFREYGTLRVLALKLRRVDKYVKAAENGLRDCAQNLAAINGWVHPVQKWKAFSAKISAETGLEDALISARHDLNAILGPEYPLAKQNPEQQQREVAEHRAAILTSVRDTTGARIHVVDQRMSELALEVEDRYQSERWFFVATRGLGASAWNEMALPGCALDGR